LHTVARADLLCGIVTVVADGEASVADPATAPLYADAPYATVAARLTAIPYCLWANRGAHAMQVWLPMA
jgi:uncharacterized protein